MGRTSEDGYSRGRGVGGDVRTVYLQRGREGSRQGSEFSSHCAERQAVERAVPKHQEFWSPRRGSRQGDQEKNVSSRRMGC